MRRTPSWAVFLISVGLGVVLTRCVRTSVPLSTLPPTPPPAPRFDVPEGCLELQGGAWVHADDATWTYAGDDDGGQLTLISKHEPVRDAGFSPRTFRRDAGVTRDGGEPDAGLRDGGAFDAGDDGSSSTAGPSVVLVRTDAGFVGFTLATFRHPTGRQCEVRFPTHVLSCDGGLWLESHDSAAVGDGCQAPANPAPPGVRQHHLRRSGIGASNDAGRDP